MTLNLVCSRSWMRDEFAAAGVDFRHSYGLDVPRFEKSDIWWMPQGYAVSLNRALRSRGLQEVRLTAPSPSFLDDLQRANPALIGREVNTLTVKEAKLLSELEDGWWKFATAKVEQFAAQKMSHQDCAQWMIENQIPEESILQYTPTTLDIVREYRTFVRHGEVVASSIYLDHTMGEDGSGGVTVYDGAIADPSEQESLAAFVREALSLVDHPEGFVVDIAFLQSGEQVVLEANPAWCSAWYDCDIVEVVETIAASFADPSHVYTPDAFLVERDARLRVLEMAPVLSSSSIAR